MVGIRLAGVFIDGILLQDVIGVELIRVELVRMQMLWSEGIGILYGKREVCWDGWRDGSYADLFLVRVSSGGFVGIRMDLAGGAYCWI